MVCTRLFQLRATSQKARHQLNLLFQWHLPLQVLEQQLTVHGQQRRLGLPVHPRVVVRLARVLSLVLGRGAADDQVTLAADLQSVGTGWVRSG